MKILGISEDYYEVQYGHGGSRSVEGPYYTEYAANDVAYLLMTEGISKPMKNRTWLSVKKNNKALRTYRRLSDDVWKEFPVE